MLSISYLSETKDIINLYKASNKKIRKLFSQFYCYVNVPIPFELAKIMKNSRGKAIQFNGPKGRRYMSLTEEDKDDINQRFHRIIYLDINADLLLPLVKCRLQNVDILFYGKDKSIHVKVETNTLFLFGDMERSGGAGSLINNILSRYHEIEDIRVSTLVKHRDVLNEFMDKTFIFVPRRTTDIREYYINEHKYLPYFIIDYRMLLNRRIDTMDTPTSLVIGDRIRESIKNFEDCTHIFAISYKDCLTRYIKKTKFDKLQIVISEDFPPEDEYKIRTYVQNWDDGCLRKRLLTLTLDHRIIREECGNIICEGKLIDKIYNGGIVSVPNLLSPYDIEHLPSIMKYVPSEWVKEAENNDKYRSSRFWPKM